jgi:hypothetical protein
MSWEEGKPAIRPCPCGMNHYVVITRSDDWNRFDESWEMRCPLCAEKYGLYQYNYNRKGFHTTGYEWLPQVTLQELSVRAEELKEAEIGLKAYAIAQHGEPWTRHFDHKTKKAVWCELTEDGKHYPSLPTFYAHVREFGLNRVLAAYFEHNYLPTVVRVLQLSGSELESRMKQVGELQRLHVAQHIKRSTKPSLFRAPFRWLNPGDGDSTATTHRRPQRTGPPAIRAAPGAARCTARGRWHVPFR